MYRMDKTCLELATYKDFATAVLQTIGTYFHVKSPKDVRIQYRDNEVWQRPPGCLQMLTTSSATPVAAVSAEKTVAERRRSILPSKLSCFGGKSFRSTSLLSSEAEQSKYRSPLDVFLDEKKRKRWKYKNNKLMCSAATGARNTRKPVCGKCHLEGHNKLNCGFGECFSVRFCHLLHKHPDEKR